MRRRSWLLAGSVVVGAALASCSDEGSPGDGVAATASVAPGPVECAPAAPPLVVDQIDDALAAIAADRPGPQQFYEVNATAAVVNAFLAATDGSGESTVVPYSWAAGELRAEEQTAASGNTFDAAAIAIDPQRVLSCVVAELPESTLDAFVVEGGPDGAVRYTVVVTSRQGGQLVVEVNGQGQVVAVDTV